MTPRERFQRIEAIFRAARARPPAESDAFVADACGDDDELLDEVLGMLRADATSAGVVDRGVLADPSSRAALGRLLARSEDCARAPQLPARVGRFTLLRVLGEGGMGVVYEAEQDEPKRPVALKVMHAGTTTSRSLRRFHREAEVLGRLRHPGIAQIFESGVDDWGDGAQPYIAMELVEGVELLRFAHERELGPRERLSLIALICDAVHHAHQKGVIHRDLKPANILVVETASNPERGSRSGLIDLHGAQPKILDFGIARLLDADSGGATPGATSLHTGVGQILGTLAYMSPEQADGSTASIDTRSDLYSIGVIAYELLAGRLPHDLDGRPLHDALRIRRESTPTRLGTLDRRLRGDIETIVAKALEVDPTRRYASAAEMSADIRRFLRDEPILARRTGAFGQFRRFARRNRTLVGSAVVIALMLLVTAIVSVRLAAVAESARQRERELRTVADNRAEALERVAYRASLGAAAAAISANELGDAASQLYAAPPSLRGWEWHHLRSRLDDALLVAEIGTMGEARVMFTAKDRLIVAAMPRGEIQIRRGDDLSLLTTTPIEGNFRVRWVRALAAHPDGGVAVASRLGLLHLDPLSGRCSPTWIGTKEVLAVSADGRFAIVRDLEVEGQVTVSVIEIADDRVIARHGPVKDREFNAAFSPDGRWAVLAGTDLPALTINSTHDGALVVIRPEHRRARHFAFAPLHPADHRETPGNGSDGGYQRDGGWVLAFLNWRGGACIMRFDHTGVVANDVMIPAPGSPMTALALSPDGQRLAVALRDGTVQIHRTRDGEAMVRLRGHAAGAHDIAFSADGDRLVTACAVDGTIRVWPASIASSPFALPVPGTVYSVAFSPSGDRLVAGCLGGEAPIRVFDRWSGREIAAFGEGAVSAVAFDASGAQLAIGRSHDTMQVLDAADGTLLETLHRHVWRTDWVRFSASGDALLSIGNQGSIRRDPLGGSGAPVARKISRGTDHIGRRAVLSRDGRLIHATAANEILRLDGSTLEELGRMSGHTDDIAALDLSPDGSLLASAGADRTIRIWNTSTNETIAELKGHTSVIYAVAFSPDGSRLATAGDDRVIRIWDTSTWEQLVTLGGHPGFIYCLAWSPDGTCLASGGAGRTMRLWDTRPYWEALLARSE